MKTTPEGREEAQPSINQGESVPVQVWRAWAHRSDSIASRGLNAPSDMGCIRCIKAENLEHSHYPPTDTQNEEPIDASCVLIEIGIGLGYEGLDGGDASWGIYGITQSFVQEDSGVIEPIRWSGNAMAVGLTCYPPFFEVPFGGSEGTAMFEYHIISRQRRDKREEVLPP